MPPEPLTPHEAKVLRAHCVTSACCATIYWRKKTGIEQRAASLTTTTVFSSACCGSGRCARNSCSLQDPKPKRDASVALPHNEQTQALFLTHWGWGPMLPATILRAHVTLAKPEHHSINFGEHLYACIAKWTIQGGNREEGYRISTFGRGDRQRKSDEW